MVANRVELRMRGYQREQRQLPALRFPIGVVTNDFLKNYVYGLVSNYTGVTRAEIIESSARELKAIVSQAFQSLVKERSVLVLHREGVLYYATVQADKAKQLAEVNPFNFPVNLESVKESILEALSRVHEMSEAQLFEFFKKKLVVLIARADKELKDEGKIRMFEDCYETAYKSGPFRLRTLPRSPYTDKDVRRFVLKLLVLGDKKWAEIELYFSSVPEGQRRAILSQATDALNDFISRKFVYFHDGVYRLNPNLSKHAWNVHDAVKAYFKANRQAVRSDFVENTIARGISLDGASEEDKLLLVFAALAQLEQLEFLESERQEVTGVGGRQLVTVWTPTQKLLNGSGR